MLPTVYNVIRSVQSGESTTQPAVSQQMETWQIKPIPLAPGETLEAIWLAETVILPAVHFIQYDTTKRSLQENAIRRSHLKPPRLERYRSAVDEHSGDLSSMASELPTASRKQANTVRAHP